MKDQIEKAFPQSVKNKCIKTLSDSKFWISDQEENSECKLLSELSDDCDFEVLNPQKKEINFLAIDKCVFDDSDSKRCDFALFNKKNLVFVEIKANVKPRNRSQHRKKGLKQLAATIEIFKRKIDFSDTELEAYLCFSSSTYPRQTVSNQSKIIEFYDNYKANLKYSNQKEF